MAQKHVFQRRLWFILLPLSWIYGFIMFIRAFAYRHGFIKSYASEVPTICIGNISWGGTGKTPVTNYLISLLEERKNKTVLLTRGYKTQLPEYPFLLNTLILNNIQQNEKDRQEYAHEDSVTNKHNSEHAFHKGLATKGKDNKDDDEEDDEIILPDESIMLLKNNKQLEIIISPDRVLGAQRVLAFADLATTKQSHLTNDHSQISLEANPAFIYADFLIMDDGFQHRRFGRDYDIVLLDKDDFYPEESPFGLWDKRQSWNKQIPLGTWREHVAALKKADIFLTKCPQEEWLMIREYALEKLAPYKKPLFLFELNIENIKPVFEEETSQSAEILNNNSPYALVCGVANPQQVEESVTKFLGYAPTKTLFVSDHNNFKKEEVNIRKLLNEMPVICTEKDEVKLCHVLTLSEAPYPLFTTQTKVTFYDSAFYSREEDYQKAQELARLMSICKEGSQENTLTSNKNTQEKAKILNFDTEKAKISTSSKEHVPEQEAVPTPVIAPNNTIAEHTKPENTVPKNTATIHENNVSHHKITNTSLTNKECSDNAHILANDTPYLSYTKKQARSIADVLKPVDPYNLDDDFDPELYKFQQSHSIHHQSTDRIGNRFPRTQVRGNLENISDFDHWLECNVFTIEQKQKLHQDYAS